MRWKVGLLGGGSLGTTVAAVVARNAPITLWARDAETVESINTDGENRKYLPGIKLPSALRATNDMAEVVAGADVLVMGVPSHSFRKIGRAACRARVCKSVSIWGGGGRLIKKKM